MYYETIQIKEFSYLYITFLHPLNVFYFVDAARETRKYTYEIPMDQFHSPQADTLIHMRLFRAHRNMYISGFTLFLYL